MAIGNAAMTAESSFEALAKGASLEIRVLEIAEADVGSILHQGPEDNVKPPVRSFLFFDEEANIVVILKSVLENRKIQGILPDLDLVLSAHVTEASLQATGNAVSGSGKLDLNTKAVSALDNAEVVPSEGVTYVVWRLKFHVARPRARLERPSIYFTCSLALKQEILSDGPESERRLLKSFEPQPANVLEPLRFDPVLSTSNVYLSESRITKMAPKASDPQNIKPIRATTRHPIPAILAIYTRLKCAAFTGGMIASLHLEASTAIGGSLVVNKVSFDAQGVTVQSLGRGELPLTAGPGDESVLLFKLTDPMHTSDTGLHRAIHITIEAGATSKEGCCSTLVMTWQTSLNLSKSIQKTAYEWLRPVANSLLQSARLPADPYARTTKIVDSAGREADAYKSISKTQTNSSSISRRLDGVESVIFNFSGPTTAIRNKDFRLDVQCNNRSNRTRQFAIVMFQSQETTYRTRPDSTSSDASFAACTSGAPTSDQNSAPHVLNLKPDVRIGPLPPGKCFETHMNLRALVTGLLDLGTLRIVDLDTKQTVDIYELPEIVGLPQADR